MPRKGKYGSTWGKRMTAEGGIQRKTANRKADHEVKMGTAKPEPPIRNAKDRDVSTYGRMQERSRKKKK